MAQAPRTTVISPTNTGAIRQGGAQVASALQGLGYAVGKIGDEAQRKSDTNYLMDTFNDVTETAQRLYFQNKESPEDFAKVFDSYQENLLSTVPNRLKPRVKQELLNQYQNRYSAVLGNFEKNRESENEATQFRFNMNAQSEIYTNFRNGNIQHATQLVDDLIAANKESGVYTPVELEVMRSKMINGGLNQRVLGEAERALKQDGLIGLTEYRNFIKDPEKSKDVFDNPVNRDSAVNTVEQMMSAEAARLKRLDIEKKAKLKATKSTVSDKIDGVIEAVKLGYEVDPNIVSELSSTATILELDEKSADLKVAQAMQEFARQTPEQRQLVLDALLDKAPDKYADFKSVDNKVTQLEKDDPLTHYQRQGRVSIESVDYNDPASISKRAQTAREVKELTGRDVPILTKIEQERLTKAFTDMPADQKTALVSNIVRSLGKDSIKTLNSLSAKNGATLALGGQLVMDGAPEVAESIFLGQQVMLNNKEIMPKESDFSMELETNLGTAYMQNPLQRATVSKAIKAVYADLSRNDGDLSGVMDSDRMKKATEMVTGGLINYESGRWSWGGASSRIEPPVRGMTSEAFEDWVDNLKPEDIDAMGGSNMASKNVLKLLKDDAELISVRVEGKQNPVYIIRTESGAIGNKDGTAPFYLEYTKGN